jgi:PKD repeat protein
MIRIYKHLLVLLLIIVSAIPLSAQYYLIGIVRDSATSTGVPNRTVQITKANSSYTKTVVSDASGFFYDTLNVVSGQHKKFYVSTTDCSQNTVIDSVVSYTPGMATLNICTAGIQLCKSDFSSYPTFSNYKKVHFINKSSLAVDKYLWTFGDGNMSQLENPFHTYATAGSYVVCLNVVDTDAYCTDSYCDTVVVSASNSCINSFITSVNGLNVSFQASVNNNHPTTYRWNFGDGTPNGFGQNITHSFSYGSTFQVCLTSTSYNSQTMDTCEAYSCQNVTVTGAPTVNIWGQVFQGQSRSDRGMVYLYSYNQSTNKYKLRDSVTIVKVDSLNISYYYFEAVPLGKYTTKAVLSKNSTFYGQFAPAYFGNTIHWSNAQQFDLHQSGYNFPINLTVIDAATGKAAISGKVMEGTAKVPGDPIEGIALYLVNETNQVLGFSHSDVNGDYSFGDLPYGKYYVYADLINYQVYPSTATPYEGDKVKKGVNIYIGKGIVTGISDMGVSYADLSVFPNPASNYVSLQMDLKQGLSLSAKLYNMMGAEVGLLFTDEYFTAGKQQKRIDISELPNGVYSLSIEDENHDKKLIKLIIVH